MQTQTRDTIVDIARQVMNENGQFMTPLVQNVRKEMLRRGMPLAEANETDIREAILGHAQILEENDAPQRQAR